MKRLTLFVMLVVAVVANTFVCTDLIVGKNASVDSPTIVSYFADSYGLFSELYYYPASMHRRGTLINIHERDTGKYLGQIEQAHQTYNIIGNMNEFQLIIGETIFSGYPELMDTIGITGYGSFAYFGLQRSRTTREAIKVMTDLVQECGYCSSGESFTIANPNEIRIMEVTGKGPGVRGTVWVVVHVSDDYIFAHVNQSRIYQLGMNGKNDYMHSPDVIPLAREKGYFDGTNEDFGFANACAPFDFGVRRYYEVHMQSRFNIFTAHGNESLSYILGDAGIPMPLFAKPSRKISVQDVKNAIRGHYEGTPLNISRDFGVGPYHTPYRFSLLSFKVGDKEYFNERPISTQQSSSVFVAQMRSTLPDAIGGVLWFGTDDANMTVFTPVYCCTDKVPVCCSCVDDADYITSSWSPSFWIFNWVSNMVYPHYDLMIGDIRATQTELEITLNEAQGDIETAVVKFLEEDLAKTKTSLISCTNMTTQNTLDIWKHLGESMIVKYNDSVVKRMKDDKFERGSIGQPAGVVRPGYPKEFLEKYVRQTGGRYKMPQ